MTTITHLREHKCRKEHTGIRLNLNADNLNCFSLHKNNNKNNNNNNTNNNNNNKIVKNKTR